MRLVSLKLMSVVRAKFRSDKGNKDLLCVIEPNRLESLIVRTESGKLPSICDFRLDADAIFERLDNSNWALWENPFEQNVK